LSIETDEFKALLSHPCDEGIARMGHPGWVPGKSRALPNWKRPCFTFPFNYSGNFFVPLTWKFFVNVCADVSGCPPPTEMA
jgi:hypothetical protein